MLNETVVPSDVPSDVSSYASSGVTFDIIERGYPVFASSHSLDSQTPGYSFVRRCLFAMSDEHINLQVFSSLRRFVFCVCNG